jgi:hypothetical protein
MNHEGEYPSPEPLHLAHLCPHRSRFTVKRSFVQPVQSTDEAEILE